nr:ubiquitin carboxyl-terminal hydrolase 36 [Quercus suber]
MLCSVPPGKSGSNWLDRLRSNKGFPTTSDDDQNNLDHFLLNHYPNPNPNPNPTESTRSDSGSTQSDHDRLHRNSTHHQQQQQQQHKQMYSLMSNVLSELFFMDGADDDDHIQSSKLSRKKFPRKQTNPKFLTSTTTTTTTPDNNNNNNTSPQYVTTPATASFDSNNSLKEVKENNVEEEEEEEEKKMKLKNNKKKEKRELVGYSRSEVTVIDTSFGVWKSEKVVYRRKNVWKVRNFGRKRKRMNGGCDDDDDNDDDNDDPDDDEYENAGGVSKKMKVLGSDSIVASNEGQNPQNGVREEVYKERTDDLIQVPKKRLPFPRSCGKSRKGGSSVILIKGLPTGKKNGEKVNSKCHKDTQR